MINNKQNNNFKNKNARCKVTTIKQHNPPNKN